jgi:hypothetical protein
LQQPVEAVAVVVATSAVPQVPVLQVPVAQGADAASTAGVAAGSVTGVVTASVLGLGLFISEGLASAAGLVMTDFCGSAGLAGSCAFAASANEADIPRPQPSWKIIFFMRKSPNIRKKVNFERLKRWFRASAALRSREEHLHNGSLQFSTLAAKGQI